MSWEVFHHSRDDQCPAVEALGERKGWRSTSDWAGKPQKSKNRVVVGLFFFDIFGVGLKLPWTRQVFCAACQVCVLCLFPMVFAGFVVRLLCL